MKNNIKQIRLAQNITQQQLADILGVHHTIVSKYEQGKLYPSKERILLIAKALNVTVDELYSNIIAEYTTKQRATSSKQVLPVTNATTKILSKWLIQKNNGHCELCGAPAPFFFHDMPYLEYHYLVTPADGGAATVDNLVVLCPNCHKRVNLLKDQADIKKLEDIAKKHCSLDV